MRHRRLAALAALPLLLTGLAACGDDDEVADDPRDEVTLQPAEAGAPVPAGFVRQQCELTTGDRSLTVVLDVPEGAEPPEVETDEPVNGCWFFPTEDGVPEVHVVLLHGADAENEADDIASLEDLEAGFEDRVGEESVYDVVFERDVPVFGEVEGDRLTWTSEADGIDESDFRAEAGDLQVWVTAQDPPDPTAVEQVFETVIASVREG